MRMVSVVGLLVALVLGGCPSQDVGIGGVYSGSLRTEVSSVPAFAAPSVQWVPVVVEVDGDGVKLVNGGRRVVVGDVFTDVVGTMTVRYTVISIVVGDGVVSYGYRVDSQWNGVPGFGQGSATATFRGDGSQTVSETFTFGDGSLTFQIRRTGTLTR